MSKSRPSPLTIRFSDAERARLVQKAGGRPLGTFIKEVVLGVTPGPRAMRVAVRDGEALGRALGLLGQSRLASNLNQLAKSANLGVLPVTADLETVLYAACAEIRLMRSLLMQALGVTAQSQPKPLRDTFADTAGGRR